MSDINKFVDEDEQYQESTEPEKESGPEEESATPPEPEQDDPAVAETTETEVETPTEENGQPDHPYDRMFVEQGLNREFQSVPDLLARVPYMRKWHTQISQENADLKRKLKEKEETASSETPQFDPESFLNNPDSYLGQKYLTRAEAEQIKEQNERLQMTLLQDRIQRFADKHVDFAQVWPVMQEVWQEEPGSVHLNDPLLYLYEKARKRMGPPPESIQRKAQQDVNKQIQKEGQRADTAGSGRKAPPAPKQELTRKDLYTMPIEELRKRLGGYGPNEEQE